jgi:hypothetical protein
MSTHEISVQVRDAAVIKFPGAATARDGVQNAVDCNSPSLWDEDGLVLFNSYAQPWRIPSRDVTHLGAAEPVTLRGTVDGKQLSELFVWIESVIAIPGKPLYGFLHYEPDGVCTPGAHLPTAPKVLAVSSTDGGRSWDLAGVVIEAPDGSLNCETKSPWDSGGHGDFTAILDRSGSFVYFFYSSYVRDPRQQGICGARMSVKDLPAPVGTVWKWDGADWAEPGLGGRSTPIFPSAIDWHRADADIFWGPSVHWNTWLGCYVMLASRAVDTRMTGDGTWISWSSTPERPSSWSTPRQIIRREQIGRLTDGGRACNATTHGWYPQVMGLGHGETDALCGKTGRLFIGGVSRAEIEFLSIG